MPDRPLARLARQPLELEDRLGEGSVGVEAEVHRRRAGVVAAAVDDDVRMDVAGDRLTMPMRLPVSCSTRACSMCISIQPVRPSSTRIDSRQRSGS